MNPLVKQFGEQSRWVTYKILERDGKKTKVPYQINGKKASSTDPLTWVTFDELKDNPPGIVFTPDGLLLGIDIDKCLQDNKIIHEDKEKIAEFILEADSYTEISPSGCGLHCFLALTEPIKLEANRHTPYEFYVDGRYFTVTQNIYGGSKDIRTTTPDEAIRLLSILGYPWKKLREVNSKEVPQVKRSTITSDRLLEKIFNSKTGAKFQALYNGDVTSFNGDESAADMSLCSTLAFWTGKNSSQMESIWLASPLGSREKTQNRVDYRKRTIDAAITACTEVYESSAQKVERQHPDLDLLFMINDKKDKVLIQNTENMCRILRGHEQFQGRLRFDRFKSSFEVKFDGVWRGIEDSDIIDIQTEISVIFPVFGKVGKDMVADAMMKVSKELSFDSAKDFITSIKWDGKKRLDSWLSMTYGVPNDVYHQAVGSNWLKGLVKRIVQPGCKFDYVLVIEGPQGAKKSMSLGILGGDWHVETTMSTDTKDFFMQFQGKAIIEFSEGETLSRTEVKKMKAIITTQSDKFRPPWGRVSQDFPRRCVFAMTTNQEEYLKDETGNRRWLPIKVLLPQANVTWLEENRNQLFAEAYERVITNKETIYEFPELETMTEQEKRQIQDPNTDNVVEWYHHKMNKIQRDQGVTTHQAYRDVYCGGFLSKPVDRFTQMNIANIFSKKLKLVKRIVRHEGILATRYFDDNKTVEEVERTPDEMLEHMMKQM